MATEKYTATLPEELAELAELAEQGAGRGAAACRASCCSPRTWTA
ncbi:hypothetical protein [Streptomyces sp. SID10853]|nr:hypothetical protein [Streptomyces sp. SID10853]